MALCIGRRLFCLHIHKKPVVVAMKKTSSFNMGTYQPLASHLNGTFPTIEIPVPPREFWIDRENFIQDATQEII